MNFERPTFSKPSIEKTPESKESQEAQKMKEAMEKYQKGFSLTDQEINDKRIADIGCGDDALFVREALNKGAENIIGVDIEFKDALQKDEELAKHLIQGNAENLSLENLDLVLSYAAVGTHPDIDMPKALESMTNAIKVGGEVRIFPVPKSETLKGLLLQRKRILDALESLDKEKISFELKPINEVQVGKDSYTDEELIITRLQ